MAQSANNWFSYIKKILKRWIGDFRGQVIQIFFSKIGRNSSIIRKTDIKKICNFQLFSYHKNIKLKYSPFI